MTFFVYRKTFERILYVLALAGVGLTLHIALWYGGENSGDGDPLCTIGSDCIGVIASDPAPLGISSAWWGFLFYALIGIGSLLIARNVGGWRSNLIKGRVVLIGLGWVYSVFLTLLQAFAIDGWCQLCLYSFSIASLIAFVTFVAIWKKPKSNASQSAPSNEVYFHGAVAVVLLAFLSWDYSHESGQSEAADLTTEVESLIDPSLCAYDPGFPAFEKLEQIVTEYDPVIGPASAPILVIEFLDPNCNHCKAVHPHIKRLAQAYPDSVRIVFKPVPIVGGPTHSLNEIAALYYANQHGVFEQMLDLVFEFQSPATGLSVDRLSEFADDLGLDEGDFRRALSDRKFAQFTVQTRRIFEGMGFSGVPTVVINDRKVTSASRNFGCLKHFLEQAKVQS